MASCVVHARSEEVHARSEEAQHHQTVSKLKQMDDTASVTIRSSEAARGRLCVLYNEDLAPCHGGGRACGHLGWRLSDRGCGLH